jgi:precorrin-2 dehydrogenase/sirohydrochlorin ferrochelatase
MSGYPIELELRGRTVLVVGLGAVGRRKAAELLAAGARVIGVDPAVPSAQLSGEIELRTESYRAEHLDGVALVFAAGPAALNRQVVADAKAAGLWVNSATDPVDGDFTVPAVWRSGGLLLTVSTAGASPALAAALRDRAASALGPAAPGLAATLIELRLLVRTRLTDPKARKWVLADWADPRWLDLWASGGPDAVRTELARILADLER